MKHSELELRELLCGSQHPLGRQPHKVSGGIRHEGQSLRNLSSTCGSVGPARSLLQPVL